MRKKGVGFGVKSFGKGVRLACSPNTVYIKIKKQHKTCEKKYFKTLRTAGAAVKLGEHGVSLYTVDTVVYLSSLCGCGYFAVVS